jgi:hypothetical protein
MKNASKKRTTFYEESLCVRALFIIEWVNPHSVGQSSLSLSDIPFLTHDTCRYGKESFSARFK